MSHSNRYLLPSPICLLLRKYGLVVSFPINSTYSPCLAAVFHIVLMGAEVQMLRIDTACIIAFMQYKKSFWYSSPVKGPCYPMSTYSVVADTIGPSSIPKLPVALSRFSP